VADALKHAALTFTTDAGSLFTAATANAAPSAMSLHLFVDVLARLGASGVLSEPWSYAALSAHSVGSPLQQLGQSFAVVAPPANTAAAASLAENAGSSVTEDVVDWRWFIVELCMTGPAGESEAPSSTFAGSSDLMVLPSLRGVANGIPMRLTQDAIERLYYSLAQEGSTFPEPALIPRKQVETIRWFFEGANLREVEDEESGNEEGSAEGGFSRTGTMTSFSLGGDSSPQRFPPASESMSMTREHADAKAFVLPPVSVTLLQEESRDTGRGEASEMERVHDDFTFGPSWHHVAPSASTHAQVAAEQRARMAVAAAADGAASLAAARALAGAIATRSSAAGDAVVRRVLIETFSLPAAAVVPDAQMRALKGISAEEELVDIAALCTTLAKCAV
jgi:hypothetical protein